MLKVLVFLVLISLIFVSGCATDTGRVVETTKLTVPGTPPEQNQTPESIEELHKEFAEFEKSQSASQATSVENKIIENESDIGSEQGESEASSAEQIQEPAKKCPSCNDNNSCTKDSCSKETSYECRHEAVIPCCGNGKCEEGENRSVCPQDCQKPECNLTCETCEVINNEACSCENITQCVSDSCCPSGCDYASDNDCPNPNLCETDSDCNDSNSCTQDTCSGQPKNCTYAPVTECLAADGCCPENCAYPDDSDCPRPSIVFSEIYYNPNGTDTKHEWIEIYNNGTAGVDVTKLRFEEAGIQHLLKNTSTNILNPISYAVISEDPEQFLSDYPSYAGPLFDSSFSLSNTGELLVLRLGKDGEILDSVFYNNVWGGDGTGFSLEKKDLNGPNIQENWNQSSVEKGTPGQRNSIQI
jgi:hypothetical protein